MCRYTTEIHSRQVAFLQTMSLDIKYLADKSRIFFKNLHQLLYTTCDKTRASVLLQALHLHTIHQLTWEGNKGNTAQKKSDGKRQSFKFKPKLHCNITATESLCAEHFRSNRPSQPPNDSFSIYINEDRRFYNQNYPIPITSGEGRGTHLYSADFSIITQQPAPLGRVDLCSWATANKKPQPIALCPIQQGLLSRLIFHLVFKGTGRKVPSLGESTPPSLA